MNTQNNTTKIEFWSLEDDTQFQIIKVEYTGNRTLGQIYDSLIKRDKGKNTMTEIRNIHGYIVLVHMTFLDLRIRYETHTLSTVPFTEIEEWIEAIVEHTQ